MRCKQCAVMWLSVMFFSVLAASDLAAHGWMAPKEAAEMKNPIASDMESVRLGKEGYLNNCAACHGNNIEGMNADETGLDVDAPNLKQRLKTHTDGDFFWKINEGRGDMPSFKDEISDEEKWHILNYIRKESEQP